ncbi:hypothetical protein VTK73DRAFT_2809 [Phialemonium thermophilum]|uniref:Uncharacterized protein n=1 Tax=Phialemonium thermophilum TaxID=223376 RepID=A0ABR3VQ04_9PEZI
MSYNKPSKPSSITLYGIHTEKGLADICLARERIWISRAACPRKQRRISQSIEKQTPAHLLPLKKSAIRTTLSVMESRESAEAHDVAGDQASKEKTPEVRSNKKPIDGKRPSLCCVRTTEHL